MKRFKKMLAFMLTLTMVFQMLGVSAMAEGESTTQDYEIVSISDDVENEAEPVSADDVGKGTITVDQEISEEPVTEGEEDDSEPVAGVEGAGGEPVAEAEEAGEEVIDADENKEEGNAEVAPAADEEITNKENQKNSAGEEIEDTAASDWVEIDKIEGLTDISAKGFAVRYLDSEGNVKAAKYFKEDEMKAFAEKYDKTPYYYTFGCGMLGYPSLAKGEGVKLTDLLNEAGITFKSGQKLMLRATDVLAEEMGITASWRTGMLDASTTDEQEAAWEAVLADPSIATKDGNSAYYTYFTYDYLMGVDRYSFAEGMAKAMLENPSMTQDDLYNSAEVIASGVKVDPLLCFGFGQIYANTVTSENDVKNIALDRGDAYRFCFGQAMDGNSISSANTRIQTAYNVFGVDVVDTEEAPEMALDDSVMAGQKAIFTFTAGENAFTDGSDFADNISEVIITTPSEGRVDLAADQYETSYNRLQAEDGSWYYIGVLTIKEGIFDEEGTYKVTVKANTYEAAETEIEVKAIQEGPALSSKEVTLRYTGDPLSIKVTDGTSNWANNISNITITDAAGTETVLTADQYEVTESKISLIRTEEKPIMSVSTKDRTAEYTIKVEATGYKTLEETLIVTMYGANSFQVRVVDSNGNVMKTHTFTMKEMKALSDKTDAYYNTICGMAGIRTFKANGISLSKLLEEAGVTFGEGMTLKLRTNDSAESENDSTTDNAYFRMGTFTYEDIMGTDRYYFSGIFKDETLKNTLLTGSKFGEDVRIALASAEKEKVEPMLAYNYVEKVYRSTEGENLTEDAYNSLVGTENAFRFLFGIAMDSENPNMISGTTTTWSASYTVFGVDIVDPSYDELVSIVNYEAHTDHAKSEDYVSGDDTQSLYVSLAFAEEMKIIDKDALLAEMNLSLGGGALSAERNVVLDAELSKDGKTLNITASGWFAAYSGKFQSAGAWSNLVSAADGTYANAEAAFYVPNGLETVVLEQVMATEDTNASVVTQIVASTDSTRGMVHLVLLKNGQPALETNMHGGNATGHFHNYMTMTAADFVDNTLTTLQNALGDAYVVTAEGDKITIIAVNSNPGDVLELHVVSYLNTNNQNVDKAELDALLQEIAELDGSAYTEESVAALNVQAEIAKVILNSGYYAQNDVDQAVAKLQAAKDALEVIEKPEDSSNPGEKDDASDSDTENKVPNKETSTSGTGNETSGTGTLNGNGVNTGDAVPIALLVLLMMASAAGIVFIKRKRENA